MNLLLDTHVLLWAAGDPEKLPPTFNALIADSGNRLFFSPASLWEIAIKRSLGRSDFQVDLQRLWRMLPLNGYRELAIAGSHAVAVETLPQLHKDPFDRILLAQAKVDCMTLLSVDRILIEYGEPVFQIG